MSLKNIGPGKNAPEEVNAIIENPMGGDPVKYELDKETGVMFVDRFLHTSMRYPGNYGFIPHTLSEDGDPVDVIVLGRTPVMPGAVMLVRPVAVLVMEDDKGKDEKIVAVPAPSLHPYHDNVDITIIEKNDEMRAALEALDLPMVILTNASRSWVNRMLEHLGYTDLFPQQSIVALEDNNYEPKAYHTTGFERCLSILHKKATRTLMVEDLPRNLPKAKELGLNTALVHHGQMPKDYSGDIDYLFQTTLELAAALRP